MAVAMTQRWVGTREQYEAVCKEVGLGMNGPGPNGSLFHWARMDGDKVFVTDVWADQASCESFYRDQLAPATQKLGLPEPENPPEFFEVINFFTAGPDTQGVSDYLGDQARRQSTS